ncbi:hypothetical protein PoB_003519500 [Plakobranchus ocellatus]|uniref:Uncharacterized protein n=1 Tax=Plakobranchus ocellatus TaxID=259542 RepID=A0AAV4AMW4_9GAST|nr:hypothetical protein PoB_003519500 [Plakobranchus ocellatus]
MFVDNKSKYNFSGWSSTATWRQAQTGTHDIKIITMRMNVGNNNNVGENIVMMINNDGDDDNDDDDEEEEKEEEECNAYF